MRGLRNAVLVTVLAALAALPPAGGGAHAWVAAAQEKAAGGDEARIVDGTLYLHTPNGFGRSKLAAELGRKGPKDGTARNWKTVTALLAMVSDEAGS